MAAADFRDKLLAGLGGAWSRPAKLNVRFRDKTNGDGFSIESVTSTPSLMTRFRRYCWFQTACHGAKPASAIICLHQHQFHLGKNEPAGLAGAAMHHTGAACAGRFL